MSPKTITLTETISKYLFDVTVVEPTVLRELLRPGGLVAVDNALWDGRVADDRASDPSTRAIRALNRKTAVDLRVSSSLVPIGDGLLLALKK
jgi:predicted O-methyltransferase YrrM